MTVSKTKAKLVDVARQLFAKMGVENTTMNDIALASKKGRRTLYTYFKSKEDIYLAVVESELDILSDMMKHVVEKDIQPDEKLMEMIYTHLDAVKEVVFRMVLFVPISFGIFGEWRKCANVSMLQRPCFSRRFCVKVWRRVFSR